MSGIRLLSVALALMAAVAFQVSQADARIGGGSSFGSRGSRTFSAPPSTSTAPGQAAPMNRTFSQPGAQSPLGTAAAPSRFGGGFGGMLMGGLLGAGLFGLLSGAGLFGGLSGFASVIGLLLQVALIGGAIWFVMGWFRTRNQPQYAGAGGASPFATRTAAPNQMAGNGAWAGGGGSAQTPSGPIEIKPEDYQAFEKLLTTVQGAYGREDVNALGAFTTPEMLSYLSGDLAENKRKGVRNEVSEAKFIQGDLSEAWTENGSDYATVAMKYTIIDATVDVATGRVVAGDRTTPQEVVELWTFRRDHRYATQGWQLSAIQQTDMQRAA
jgi:predicted lipid-binding transport protein (Tim44 family)